MNHLRTILALIILTFIVMLPLAFSVTPSAGNAPTPTQENTNQQRVLNGSLLRNVRTCPAVTCAFVYAFQPRATFWFCWQVAPVMTDRFMWALLPDGNWVSISKGNREYVNMQESYRTGVGC